MSGFGSDDEALQQLREFVDEMRVDVLGNVVPQ